MPTLTTDQSLIIPAAGDNANGPTAFSSLVQTPASSSMESRLVKRYLSAADRTSRNPTPQTGELSFRADGPNYEWFNGTTWIDLQKGYVNDNTRVVNSAGFTTTETVTDSLTFTAIAGVRYKLTFTGWAQSTIANDLVQVRFRYQAGAVLTAAGTQFASQQPNCDIANRGTEVVMIKPVTGIAAGQTTIGVTMVRSSGTGTISSAGSAVQESYLLLEIV